MKLAVCTGTYGQFPLEKIVGRIAEVGYNGVEISAVLHMRPEKANQRKRTRIRQRAEANNLEVCAIHHVYPPEVKLLSPQKRERENALDHTKMMIELASDLNCKTIVAGGGCSRRRPAGITFKQAWEWLVEIFSECADFARDCGVIVAIEPLNRYETNMINNGREGLRLVNEVGSPALKVMYDTYQMNIEESCFVQSIKQAGEQLAHVHVADSNRLAPGRGHIDFKKILRALQSIDYQGYLSLEVYSISPEQLYLPHFEEADAEVVYAKEFLDELMVRIDV